MASFVVNFRMTPDQYRALTWGEREAIVREANRQARRK